MSVKTLLKRMLLVTVACAALGSEEIASAAGRLVQSDNTIILDESQIKGESAPSDPREAAGGEPSEARPALSTQLAWEGEGEEEINLAHEIFQQLMQPDPSYLSGEALYEVEPSKGD